MLSSGVITDARQAQTLGWLMILAVSSLICFNVIVVLFYAISYARLLLIRNRVGIRRFMASVKAKALDKFKAKNKKQLGKEEELTRQEQE